MACDKMPQRSERELSQREKIIQELEGLTGTLDSVPYAAIDTNDLLKILNTINYYRRGQNG